MENEYWSRALRSAISETSGTRPRSVRLPSTTTMRFSGEKGAITISLSDVAVVANMQSNGSAFEVWSLALRVWCDAERVILQWATPEHEQSPHYQRFLYRVERFRELFPQWFQVAHPERLLSAKAFSGGKLSFNVAGLKRKESSAIRGEACLERELADSAAFREYFRLSKVCRQHPVGLFDGIVKRSNLVFTGGKSAIDLIGTGSNTLSVFELKDRGNIPSGMISELFFYANVIRDATGEKPRFLYPKQDDLNADAITSLDLQDCNRIEAILLAEEFHPLVGAKRVIDVLNKAVAKNLTSLPILHFRATRLRKDGSDFTFEEIAEL